MSLEFKNFSVNIKVNTTQSNPEAAWDAYVHAHPEATVYHLSGWLNAIKKAYGHKTYYLIAIKNIVDHSKEHATQGRSYQLPSAKNELKGGSISGILPLVHLKHLLFGNSLISIPFFDFGGILADSEEAEKALLSEAIKLGRTLKVKNIELRQTRPLSWLYEIHSARLTEKNQRFRVSKSSIPLTYYTKSNKVRMLLALPENSQTLIKSFESKLRSQLKKPISEGLTTQIGGLELLENFYKVFSTNMRDLGSPVHSKRMMLNVLNEFPSESKVFIVYKNDQPLAASMIVGFNNILENPWSSSLRKYSRLSPNMLLYWTMLEYACDSGFTYFDFGRSSPDGGTYKFKEQWGAKSTPLYWIFISLDGKPIDERTSEQFKYQNVINSWKKLPVPATKIIGPMIRKHIGL
jgi:serine/alanine adding enzyme